MKELPRGKNGSIKVQGASSCLLSNAGHCDIFDNSRSWAMWTTQDASLPPPRSWFLLFPANGLAIELGEGVAVSWDGRFAWHCSSVADVDPRVQTLSFFAGVKATTCRLARRLEEWEWVMESILSGKEGCPLAVGDRVWYKQRFEAVAQASAGFRRASATVVAINVLDESGELNMSLAFGREGSRAEAFALIPMACMNVSVVHAGAICRSNELSDNKLVGERVSVFWPGDDACYDGEVRAYDARSRLHAIAYDDGMHLSELLGGDDAPSYRVLH